MPLQEVSCVACGSGFVEEMADDHFDDDDFEDDDDEMDDQVGHRVKWFKLCVKLASSWFDIFLALRYVWLPKTLESLSFLILLKEVFRMNQ